MFLVLFLAISGCLLHSSHANCVLPLPRFRFFAPLIFSSNGTLLETDNNNEHALSITIPADSSVTLSCAPNYFKKPELNTSKMISATCKTAQTFDVNGEDMFWIPDLGCEVRSVEEIVKPITDCSDSSVVFGYENPIKEETLILGEACYSETEGRTKFVKIRTASSNRNSGRRRTIALNVENSNYLAQQHPDSKYKIDFLIAARIDELNQRLRKLSIKNVPFLDLRHFMDMLSLPNGQLYSILKLGWNFAVTNGFDHLPNYDLLMADIQKMQEGNFDLYMGTHSTLTLKNRNDNNVDIYLRPDERKFPVPKFLWVAVATQNPTNAVGFLISNNLDLSETEMVSGPCESKCTQISWLTNLLNENAYRKPENGYVWCCNIHKFMEIVPEMPKLYVK